MDDQNLDQSVSPALDDHIADHDMNTWAFAAIKDLRSRVEALEEEKKPKKK